MQWPCFHLQNFWKDIFHTLSNILKQNADLDPLVALFGITDGEDPHLTSAECRLVAFALLFAGRAVLLKWKDAAPPTLSQWLRDIMSSLKLERICFSVSGSDMKFYKTWGPFLTYFHNPQTTWHDMHSNSALHMENIT